MPLSLSHFHTALLWNITNLIGTKRGRKETSMDQSGGVQKFDFSAKVVAHCHRLGKPVVTLGYICDRQLKTSDSR